MAVREIVGVLIAIIVLAGIAVAIANGQKTAQVLQGAGDAFRGVIMAAAYGK